MDYRKERNFIVAYDGEQVRGKYDFITHGYIGIKGNPVKSRPKAFSHAEVEAHAVNNVIAYGMLMILNQGTYMSWDKGRYNNLEKLLSVGLRPSSWYDLSGDMPKLTKELVQFLKDENSGIYTTNAAQNFTFKKQYGKRVEGLKIPYLNAFLRILEYDHEPQKYFTDEQILKMLRKMQDEYFGECDSGDIIAKIGKYQKDMYGKTTVIERNIATQYYILKHLHDEWYNANRDQMLKIHNDKPCLYFETDEYIIYPLTTKEQFHDEAIQQHNCVERLYMEKVVEGNTNIVVVRDKANPGKSLVTCEVRDGNILQYLAANNSRVMNTALIQLKHGYQEHLEKNWA